MSRSITSPPTQPAGPLGSATSTLGVPPDAPVATDARALCAVAVFEAVKGGLMLLAGFGLLTVVHHDARRAALVIVRVVHLDPTHHGPHQFITAAGAVGHGRLELLAAAAFAYAVVRAVEAWGLWRLRPWAQWFGAIAGGIYLPMEVWQLVRRPTALHAAVLFINAAIVAYLVYTRVRPTERGRPRHRVAAG